VFFGANAVLACILLYASNTDDTAKLFLALGWQEHLCQRLVIATSVMMFKALHGLTLNISNLDPYLEMILLHID